jgi:hypothetical protein
VLNEKGIASALEAVNAIHKATHNLVTYECSISHGLRNFLSNSPSSTTPGRTSPDSGSSRGVRHGQEHRRNHSGSSFGAAMMAKSPRGMFTGAGMASSFPPSIHIPGQELFQSSVSPSSAGAPQPTFPEILRHDSSKYFPMMEEQHHHQQQAPRPLSSSLSSGNMGLTMSSDSSSTVGTPMGAAPRGFDFDLQHGTTVFSAQYNSHYYHQTRRGYNSNTNNSSGFVPPSSSGELMLNMNTSSQYSLWK